MTQRETSRKYATWVEPIADMLRRDRNEVIDFAEAVDPDDWARPSDVEDWTCKDILAHLAGGNDQILQRLLRTVVAGETVDPAIFSVDTDAENARAIAKQARKPVKDLIAELRRDDDEVQELLSALDDSHQDLRQDLPITLGQFMQIVHNEGHDMLHLDQLREALGD